MQEQTITISDRGSYEPPRLDGPYTLYERPLLIDIEESASCNWGCVTSGDAPRPGGGGGGS